MVAGIEHGAHQGGGLDDLAAAVVLFVAPDCERDARAAERDAEIMTVAKRKYDLESLKGITFNQFDPSDDDIYAGDPFRLQLIRIDSRTGRREVLSDKERLFDFTTATAFLPPEKQGKKNPLVTVSDQEYRWATLNVALTSDQFRPPFTVAEFWPR